jgi:alpha-beta hydrolase superfamily lysophospholipase
MNVYSVLKKPFFGRFQKPWANPEGYVADDWTRVEFPNASGARLVGLHARARTGAPKAVVVVPHPMVAEAKGWAMRSGHTDLLRDAGYDVFVFDFNGFGESENGRFEFPTDIVAAGQAAAKLHPDVPVALLGISMGAGYGVCALDTPDHPFKAAVIENAFTTLDEFWIQYKAPYVLLRTLSALAPTLARTLRPIERITTIQGVQSMFLIYGADDTATPPGMGERLLAACPLPDDKRSLWVVPQARHLRASKAAPDEYRTRVVGFLDAAFS